MKILRVIFVIAVLCAPFYAQQVNQDIVPASPGLYLGHTNQRWNGYFNNADIYNLTINGSPIGTAGIGLPQISIPNGTNCTTLNGLVEFDGNGQAQTASLSSAKVIGVAVSGAGCSGNVLVQYAAIVNCTTDGSTLINDRIAASNSIPGDCMDIGPISIPGIQTVGLVTAVSSGAGQLTSFDLFTGDTISPSSSSGSGVVSVSPCIGPIGYAATAAAIVSWDCNTSLDGSGNAGFKKVTVTGSGAGKIDFGTSTTPGNPSAGFFRLYADSGTGFLTCLTSSGGNCNPSGSSAFSAITNGTNTTAAMHVGTGASLDTSGSGTIVGTGLTAAKTQGTDTKYLTSGTMGASGATLCQDALGGASTTGCTAPFVSGLVTSGLLAEYRFNEGTGTTLTDYSGNANNGTFCGSGPSWVAGNPTNSGLQFIGTSNQCINLPSALNTARTVILVTSFTPANAKTIQAPVCGNTANDWGGIFRSFQLDPGNASGVNPMESGNGGEYFIGGFARAGFPYQILTTASSHGTQIIAWTLGSASDSTHDQVWVNNNLFPYAPIEPSLAANLGFGGTAQSAGFQTSGNYVLGGSASGSCVGSVSTWFSGYMYYALFYSGFLTQAQLGQDFVVIASSLAQRGIQLGSWNAGSAQQTSTTNQSNQYVAVGDSITYGTGVATVFPQYMTFPTTYNTWNWVDIGLPSEQAIQYSSENTAQLPQGWIYPDAASNAVTVWLGTNDCGVTNTTAAGQNAYANLVNALRQMRLHGTTSQNQKIIVASMISRTALDNCKNGLNGPLRQQWSGVADGFADVAADPNLGADGASAGTTYFQVDAVHPTSFAQANDIAPIMQRAVRRAFGNLSWTSATTYTTTAAAATATTAGSESTNTVTITFGATPANCVAGNQITIAGTTPAGYSGTWQILTRTATQVTYFDASGLGAITVQGTGVCASQQDEDVYTILGGSASAPNFTLESCVGYTGQNLYFKNTNTSSAWTITPFGTETIDGSASFTLAAASATNNPVIILQAVLVSAAAGGCNWKTLSVPASWQCTNVTPVTVNTNTAADQNMMACTIPAATLNSVNKTLRIYAAGVYSTPAASTSQMTMKAKLCTVSGCGSGTVITPINIQSTALGTLQITNDNFSLHSDVTTQTVGASSAYEAHGEFLIDLSTLTTAADSSFGDTNTATVGTIDATAQLFLQVTFAFSNASASNSATQRQLIVDTVN